MRFAVTGPNGFVGSHILAMYPDAVVVPSLRGGEAETKARIRALQTDAIIHTAAIADMGACEKDPDASYRANVLLPVWIAEAAPEAVKLVFFSTDQVYNGIAGEGPYTEEAVCPANVYARHKVEMEQRVAAIRPDAVFLRATWMFSADHGYVPVMTAALRSGQPVAAGKQHHRGVTYVREVAENIPATITLPGGAYNFGSENMLSTYTLAEGFRELAGLSGTIEDTAPRHNLWMDCAKARTYGVRFSNSLDALARCLQDAKG